MRRTLLALLALGTTLAGLRAQEQRPTVGSQREMSAGDLAGGYVLPGEEVETTGYLGVRRGAVWLKLNRPSAQVGTRVDVSRLSAEAVRELTERCAADNEPLTIGGCTVRVRGRMTFATGARPSLAAEAIVVLGPPQ